MHGALEEAALALKCDTAVRHEGGVTGRALRVRGLVQGVGFRPNVWRLAQAAGVTGDVLNDGEGVLIRAWGTAEALGRFESALVKDVPPLARIDAIERVALADAAAPLSFSIAESIRGAVATGIAPDAATCPACLEEVLDPASRRHRYAFTNCTHCGPRLSIVRAIPYDRAATAMAPFQMCGDCCAEYDNPADRRFHAEPIACPACGPQLSLEDAVGEVAPRVPGEDAIAAASRLIAEGRIVTIKGIGGFHLACDAVNEEAVARLRQRKHRYHKPFALMAADLAMVAAYARVGAEETRLLQSAAAPIVVLDVAADSFRLAESIAPGQASLGFMLPYTPLHHLLMRALKRPIVLTSGNRSDEPQCTGNEEARARLQGIADFWLLHDRDIVNRLDDSVVRVIEGAPVVLRRARGYAPEPIRLPEGFGQAPRVLAMGAELKSTFCLLRGSEAILSQHIGDLEDASTHADYRTALDLYHRMFAFQPDVVAIDRHPDYLSTQWGRALAAEEGAGLCEVQHHHAHVAACLAEHGVALGDERSLGLVLDGLGMGSDATLWGGEVLLADYHQFERLAHFAPVPLLGGAKAMREPWRNAFAHLECALGWDEVGARYPQLDIVKLLGAKPVGVLRQMMASGVNAPAATSAGRLFDAVAAVLGVCPEATSYEGQAAIELEALAEQAPADSGDGYPIEITDGAPGVLAWASLWRTLLDDLVRGIPREVIARRFHAGLASGLARLCSGLAGRHGVQRIVLSGGVLQNRMLAQGLANALRKSGLDVLTPGRVPANDGGIALGQAVIAAARTLADGKGH